MSPPRSSFVDGMAGAFRLKRRLDQGVREDRWKRATASRPPRPARRQDKTRRRDRFSRKSRSGKGGAR